MFETASSAQRLRRLGVQVRPPQPFVAWATRIVVDAVVIIASWHLLTFGGWAFAWPRAFYAVVAHVPQVSRHLAHDAGAFQRGSGATLLIALFCRHDGLFTVLAGSAVAGVTHAASCIAAPAGPAATGP